MFDSVRVRLTLWYAGVLALSLIAFALVIYYAAGNIFHERQDESLRSTAQTVASAYVEEFGEAHSLSKAGGCPRRNHFPKPLRTAHRQHRQSNRFFSKPRGLHYRDSTVSFC